MMKLLISPFNSTSYPSEIRSSVNAERALYIDRESVVGEAERENQKKPGVLVNSP
jgi:hypothetical protein